MRQRHSNRWLEVWFVAFLSVLASIQLQAQPLKTYTMKHGRMYIQLPKEITASSLDSFVTQFDLADLDLKNFLRTNKPDSLHKLGWKVEANSEVALIISKAMEPFNGLSKLDDKIFFGDRPNPLFPAVNNGIVYGVNRFRNKQPFAVVDSTVRFFLRSNQNAKQVFLAGSFNNWVPEKLPMQKTDSGWIYDVKLGPGKYWYKFIVDGNWFADKDNLISENDGLGNINSVFFRPNISFRLPGFSNAKKVFLAGSFNGWKPDALPLKKSSAGWEVPIYLAEGTHTYKFVIDGQWSSDESNKEKVPDGHGQFNSVIRLGKPYLFKLKGHSDAREVILVGSFNQWRDFEWPMKKTLTGWELPYTLGDGNYEYKFKVDGKWVSDPANVMTSPGSGNSFLIINPNYTFLLKGFTNAKDVFLAGDFNDWDPKAYRMKKEGNQWIFPVHLSVGKHLYKFVVDGQWITDPGNKLWEQNEYSTGNSILWIPQ